MKLFLLVFIYVVISVLIICLLYFTFRKYLIKYIKKVLNLLKKFIIKIKKHLKYKNVFHKIFFGCNIIFLLYFFFLLSLIDYKPETGNWISKIIMVFINNEKLSIEITNNIVNFSRNYSFLILIYIAIILIINIVRWVVCKILILRENTKFKKECENNQLYKNLFNYLSNPEDKIPILIVGQWGAGKTFSLENFIQKYYKHKNQKIYKISCFGINTKENLIQTIRDACEREDNSIYNKLIKLLNKIPIIGEFLKEVFERKYDFSTLKRGSVFVFDNFERISPIIRDNKNILNKYDIISKYNIVSGLIDELIEEHDMKIIIITNEKEMVSKYVQETFIEKLSCKRFFIEPKKDIFIDSWNANFNSIQYPKEFKKELEEVFYEVKDDAIKLWKISKCRNVRTLNRCLYNYMIFICTLLSEGYQLDISTYREKVGIFYTNYIVNIFVEKINYIFNPKQNISLGDNIGVYFSDFLLDKSLEPNYYYRELNEMLKDKNCLWYSDSKENVIWINLLDSMNSAKKIVMLARESDFKYFNKFNYSEELVTDKSLYEFKDIVRVLSSEGDFAIKKITEIFSKANINYMKESDNIQESLKAIENNIENYNISNYFFTNIELENSFVNHLLKTITEDELKKFCKKNENTKLAKIYADYKVKNEK